MIIPDDFLTEAVDLFRSADGREARLRTAVSRAYYAAYHAGRLHAEAHRLRVVVPVKGGVHVRLVAQLRSSTDQRVLWAAEGLAGLKGMRVQADYGIGSDLHPRTVREALDLASRILAAFKDYSSPS
ncbi:hypothetical protein HL658_29765 [Azospirillum sp. RWY-5-1]|uniref:HEPN domain-containing protein n=1 Tax=Azospirillum oleiclasticum TaxID=2735135 RepID=A0ABX2TL27_9PROT|nr:hypothetical protein [Azospirillum oleiclasticum]NYZ16754.1 hypothetical protein [Azospirillum oleiclasticum]NYZ23345.1 hypothetical protein [Azospirillum oleiclasticum]